MEITILTVEPSKNYKYGNLIEGQAGRVGIFFKKETCMTTYETLIHVMHCDPRGKITPIIWNEKDCTLFNGRLILKN